MTFTLSDLVLAAVAGSLTGALLYAGRMRARHERPIARLVSALLEPIYYWVDLKGPDGRPSHSKVAYFMVLFTATVVLVLFALQERAHQEAAGDSHDVSLGFISYAALVMAFALGKQAFNAVLSIKLGDRLGKMFDSRASGSYRLSGEQAPGSDVPRPGDEPPPGGSR